MEFKIQLEINLLPDEVIGSHVSDESKNEIIGEIISYDTITGIAICKLYKKS